MPEHDDAILDALLSATFAALPVPAPSPNLQARIREQVQAEAASPPPVRVHIVEQRQGNVWTRVACRTEANRPNSRAALPAVSEKHVTRLRMTLLVNRKGNP